MNLREYTDALARAEERAATLQVGSVIKYWEPIDQCADLRLDQDWMTDMTGCRILATVDHQGIITESRWIKEQLGLQEVAA